MSLLEKYNPASYRGIDFLVPNERANRGKKIIAHEYPNSDDRYAEELGKIPPIFSVTAIIHGDDAINVRIRLENALEQSGLGLLVHPIYGRVMVKAGPFTVSSDQTEIGQFSFDIQFYTSRENVTPEPDIPTNLTVSGLGLDARTAAGDRLQSLYKEPSISTVFDSVVATVQDVFDTVHSSISSVVDKTTAGAAAFDRVYRSVTRNISSIVSSAQTLRDNLTLFYDTALDVPALVDQLGDAWNNLIDYPFTVSTTSPLTSYQFERDQNNYAITEHLKLIALANSYESQVYTDFTTDSKLFTTIERLNDVYTDFFKSQNEDITTIGLDSIADDPTVRAAYESLRVAARKVFDEKEKIVYRIVDIKPGLSSMALANFRFYGNLDLIDQMTSLNELINVANFNQIIKALTE